MTTKTKKSGSKKPGVKDSSSSRSIPIAGIVFGIVAVVLIAAIVLSSEEPIGSGGEYGEPAITGETLPAMAAGQTVVSSDPAVGLVAPEINGQDFDDSTVTISHDGTPKAIVFLAHWCSHCQAEVPRVQAWLEATGGVDGVDVMSVTTSASSGQQNWPPSEWMARENWTSPNIRDNQDSGVLSAFGGSSFPYWVFLNGDGTVALRVAGQTDIATLETIMGTLN